MTHTNEMTLKGRLNIELLPRKNWRELAVAGVKSLTYIISGRALIDGEEWSVNVRLPALNNGEICGLGAAKPWGAGDEAQELILGFYPKNPRPDRGLDTAFMAVDNENKVLIDENGCPVYDEPPITCEDGSEFDLRFGTHFFCPSRNGLTLSFSDVSLKETERLDENGLPFIDCSASSYSVVPALSTRAKGATLAFTCKAARSSTAAAPETTPDTATVHTAEATI